MCPCAYVRVSDLLITILYRTINHLGYPLGGFAGLKHSQLARGSGDHHHRDPNDQFQINLLGDLSSSNSKKPPQIRQNEFSYPCLHASRIAVSEQSVMIKRNKHASSLQIFHKKNSLQTRPGYSLPATRRIQSSTNNSLVLNRAATGSRRHRVIVQSDFHDGTVMIIWEGSGHQLMHR
jgi:hypothetical protein